MRWYESTVDCFECERLYRKHGRITYCSACCQPSESDGTTEKDVVDVLDGVLDQIGKEMLKELKK